jgi:prolipoprotein diacylglyceryltransferase
MFILAGIVMATEKFLPRPGQSFGLCLVLYGAHRFFAEYLRVNPGYYGLTSAQWISIAMLICGSLILWQKISPKPAA